MTDHQLHQLAAAHTIETRRIPDELLPDPAAFEQLWRLHPAEYPIIRMSGRLVPTPRWQQAFAHDYAFAGQVSQAVPVSDFLAPYLAWAISAIDDRLNGILVNWYDGSLGHYIGRHRDSRHGLVPGRPIITVSFGEARTFRLRPWGGSGQPVRDFPVTHGDVVILPYATNLSWTHEVPRRADSRGRRISLTFRAFAS